MKRVEKLRLDPITSFILQVKKLPKKYRMSKGDFETVWNAHPEEHSLFNIGGNSIPIPRWQKVYLRDYKFSGSDHQAAPESELPLPVLKLLKFAQKVQPSLNGVLINWYQDGNHYIGYHSDAEKDLVKGSNIWSFSFGQSRQFYLKSKESGEFVKLDMPNNSLLVMCGTCQTTHKHSVPKVLGEKGKAMERRINVTFRSFE